MALVQPDNAKNETGLHSPLRPEKGKPIRVKKHHY
jgi:hypothetical protein